MAKGSFVGYVWIVLGLCCIIYFGGELLLKLLGIFVGFALIFKGMRILAMHRVVYNYSRHYFEDQFKK